MKYNRLEDKAIQILHNYHADDYKRPQWGQIVNLMNRHRKALNAAKASEHYTVSKVRNRHQRMTRLTHGKPKRNVCSKCGLLLRGHTCLGERREDVTDEVYNLLGIKEPMTEQDEELPTEYALKIPQSTATASFQMEWTACLLPEEPHDLFKLFQSYDEHPEPIENYQAAWDNV